MFGTFQEVLSIKAYSFSGKSCAVTNHSKIKKLTVSQELLNEIMAVGCYTLKQISHDARIPLATLRHIKSGETKEPRAFTFQKIFALYCQICQSHFK